MHVSTSGTSPWAPISWTVSQTCSDRSGKPVIRRSQTRTQSSCDDQGVLLHTKIGENQKPDSKCEDFRRILDEKLSGQVDVALFKFCYVDFSDTSDVDAIFSTYARTMDDLKRRHPEIIFIHVTAPLRTVDRGFGVWAREMLGRRNRTKLANVSRNEFNRRLLEKYSADPIYDLAGVMSTYPDGKRESFELGGKTYYSLVPAYTDDGGHLNIGWAILRSRGDGPQHRRRGTGSACHDRPRRSEIPDG